MSGDDRISREQYSSYLDKGIPYEGIVEQLGQALKTIVITAQSRNSSNTEIFLNINYVNICVVDNTKVFSNHHIQAENTFEVKSKETQGHWVQRNNEIFYDREIYSPKDAEKKYGKKAKYLKDGTSITDKNPDGSVNSEYTLLDDNLGMVKDRNGQIMDNSQNISTGSYIIYATCDTCLDPGTLYKNWLFNTTYIGPNNPKCYDGKWSYDYLPKNISEYPAIAHDKAYDQIGIEGIWPALTDTRAIDADLKLVQMETIIAMVSGDPLERFRGQCTAGAFSLVLTFKFVIKKIENAGNKAFDLYNGLENSINRAINPVNWYP